MLLQDMREKAQGWVAKVIVAAIAFTFAIFGLESLSPNTGNPDVATVNGEAITQQQLMETMDQQRRVLIQQMGDNFDPSMLDSPMLQNAALESLIQRALLRARLQDDQMVVSEAMLDEVIRTAQEFQVDGQYSPDRVMQYVRNMGMTVAQFRNMLREEMISTQLRAGIAASEFMTTAELQQLNNLQTQTRDISWLTLNNEQARNAVNVSDDDVAVYYADNGSRFMQPEQVSVDYIVLDKNKIAETIQVSDADIRARYNAQVADLKNKASNELRASMILLEPNGDRDEAATLAQANELSTQLKNGADFAALAQEFSDDPDSAAQGGSLGAVETGFFGSEFDSALAGLEAGAVSEPVQTDFGVVLIRRDGSAEARIPSLEQMRASIERELRNQAVDPLFVEQSQMMADISFEASDLAQPAETMGLEIQSSPLFGRNGGEGIAANARVVAAAFSEDVLELRANSDLVELSPEQVAVLHIREHKKSEQKPVADVKDEIVAAIQTERGAEQLKQRAEAVIAELNGGANAEQLATSNGLTWAAQEKSVRFNREVPAQLLAEAFRLPHPAAGQFSYGTATLPNGDIAVIRIANVVNGNDALDADQARMMGTSLALRQGTQMYDEYVRNLRDTADIKVVQADSEG
ncbi:SurA N-terminal domain-containing protein [Parendozoicomonas haliclonae]|uniref:Periplasmic chaperone PpiD n=1 Tax=Parendozoicomonas haliclonae TaxID=1960125 RepID=A0A1X7AMB9_9GAMM|nr:SurA N-terminal domain-containing protein [Parendozoicomonas haliclonae]SMA49020.1 Peptidyl-prolyl cis-trans isomerase D [Parendozoicomonas haliclonae]